MKANDLIIMDMLGLEKINIKEILENKKNNDREILLQYINGFNSDKTSNSYIDCFEDLEKVIKKFDLNINNIVKDNECGEFAFLLGCYVYVYHGFIIDINFNMDSYKLFEHIKKICDKLDKCFIDNEKLSVEVFNFVPKRFSICMFNLFYEYLNEKDLINYGKHLFLSSDYGSNSMDYDVVEKIFKEGKEDLKKLCDKDGYIELYRGCGEKSKSPYEAYSWTLSLDVAKFFATRFSNENSDKDLINIYKIRINIDDVIGYVGGVEEEVILDKYSIEYYDIETVDFDKTIRYKYPKSI